MSLYLSEPQKADCRDFSRMASLISDQSHQELLEFAREINLNEQWLQNEKSPKEYFILFDGKIDLAKQRGVKEIPVDYMVRVFQKKRRQDKND